MLKKAAMLVFLLGTFVFLSPVVFAHSKCDRGASKCEGQCPIAGKMMMKAHMLLENKSDLALTDEQVKAIKELKLQGEKDSITQMAEMKTFMLDLESKLSDDKTDVEGANALIDKGFASASAGAKSNLAAYAKLQSILTADQAVKMKALHEKKEKEEKEERKNRKK